MNHSIRALLGEPRFAPPPPRRVWRDWALVAVVVVGVVLELVLRDDLVRDPIPVAGALILAAVLPARRTHPFGAAMTMAGTMVAMNLASIAADTPSVDLNSMVWMLVLPYSLTRWGSGREIWIGFGVFMVALASSLLADPSALDEQIASVVILLIPFEAGAILRFWYRDRRREIEDTRTREREQLARELHDTVAHHVSAIAVRAQAGQAVAATSPHAAVEALAVIEDEATRMLAEMRTIVGVLRAEGDPELTPQPGLDDVRRLAATLEGRPLVDVAVADGLDNLNPSVGAAVFRIAQESVTNALRHAEDATEVMVTVDGDEDLVRLRITDDGKLLFPRDTDGFGIRGMSERAKLLGGTLTAGPATDGGWVVDAVLPRRVR